jgi:hypothetical protein
MTEIRKKAAGITRQIVGEMIGDALLVEEGKQKQHEAEQASNAASFDRDPDKPPPAPGQPARKD